MKLQWNRLKKEQLKNEKLKKGKRKKKKLITLELIQNVHHQFFQRLYDLDYLQWMQRNVKNYTVGIGVLTLLLSVSILTMQRQQEIPFYSTVANQPALQETTQENKEIQKNATVEQHSVSKEVKRDRNLVETNTAEQSQSIAEPEQEVQQEGTVLSEESLTVEKEKEKSVTYQNPTQFSDYVPPTNGQLEQDYGLHYSTIYDDYRFCTMLRYHCGDGCVVSCRPGTVTQIQLADTWQLALQTQDGMIWYQGLDTCTVSSGTQVTAGTPIGTATGIVSIQAST